MTSWYGTIRYAPLWVSSHLRNELIGRIRKLLWLQHQPTSRRKASIRTARKLVSYTHNISKQFVHRCNSGACSCPILSYPIKSYLPGPLPAFLPRGRVLVLQPPEAPSELRTYLPGSYTTQNKIKTEGGRSKVTWLGLAWLTMSFPSKLVRSSPICPRSESIVATAS